MKLRGWDITKMINVKDEHLTDGA